MSKQVKFLVVVAIIAGIAGLYTSQIYYNDNKQLEFQSLLLYPNHKTFSGFELVNQNNEKITIESFSDKWTLLFFGFTHCPDVCPTTLTELQRVFQLIKTKEKPEVLFVSVDPERDNPQQLKGYIDFFNPEFNAATADTANILALTTQIGVAYHIGEHAQEETNYTVDHTAAIFLINPEKKLYGIFRSPHNANKISSDLNILLGSLE